MKFSTDDLKKMFDKDKIGNWIVKYKRQVAAGCVLVCLVVAAAFSLGGKDAEAGKNGEEASAASLGGADMQAVEAAVEENVLEKNAYPEVNEIIQKYFDYIATGDMEGLTSITDVITDDVKESILKSKDLVDSYQNIECYTKKGLNEGEYLVFACYEQNFINKISTPAPGMKAFYVCTNDEGKLYIFNGEFSVEQEAFIEQMAQEEDVIALKEEVRAKYEAAKEEDVELAKLEETANKKPEEETQGPEETAEEPEEVSEGAEEEEPAEEPEEEPSEEDTSEENSDGGEATAVNKETRFTESIRLRSGRGTDTDYLGTAYQGESVTRIEDYSDGWSKISYNGKECYCMTKFLE